LKLGRTKLLLLLVGDELVDGSAAGGDVLNDGRGKLARGLAENENVI
jgi:hypothetical protein